MKLTNFNRPGKFSHTTTPAASNLIELMGGGELRESVALSNDEMRQLRKLYAFAERPKLDKNLEDMDYKDHNDKKVNRFMQAGDNVSLLRFAETDGLRLLAWLAKYVEPGADPLKTLIQLAIDAGFDVSPDDISWANSEEYELEDE